MDIKGINGEIIANNIGGKQSKLDYRFDLMDSVAIFKLAGVLHEGSVKYEPNNWRKIPINDHLNHALSHIFAYLAGDNQEEHLPHAFCRLMMAVALDERR